MQKIIKIAIANVIQHLESVVERIGRIVAKRDNAKDISMVMFAMQDYQFQIAQAHDQIIYNNQFTFSAEPSYIYFFSLENLWEIRMRVNIIKKVSEQTKSKI